MKTPKIRMLIPTGRMNSQLMPLLTECGYHVEESDRNYRPRCQVDEIDVKFLKPINIPNLIAIGRHDFGFCGMDWVKEHSARVEVMLELGLNPVRLVLAAPEGTTLAKLKKKEKPVLATEYVNIGRKYLKKQGINAIVLRTNGTTEVYPPDDADMIIDNTSTGSTLKANQLAILDTLMHSSTSFLVNRELLKNSQIRKQAENIAMLLEAALVARRKVMLEMNVSKQHLDQLLNALPAMKSPTVQPLAGGLDFAVRSVVDKNQVGVLIPALKKAGATDIVEQVLRKVLP